MADDKEAIRIIRNIVAAWDALPEGDYGPHETFRWLDYELLPTLVQASEYLTKIDKPDKDKMH